MADLKLLTERVVEKEKAALRQKVEQTQVEAEDEIQASQAAEAANRQQLKDDVKAKVEREYAIKKNTLEIQKRNAILSAKQNVLSKVIADAKEKMNTIDAKTFQVFVVSVLQQFKNEEKVTLTFGEKSAHLVDENWIRTNGPKELTVHVASETIPDKSGFIVEKAGIDYNFIFDTLVDEVKSDILSDISNELF
ncbi:V/A-type H+-transporting ATPase subunit E [Alkalibacterium subtropicum]|uniref:V/A-type H+-transporting ATPase subunit E n=1 Tax=Alkalibacterium subtropicum TaxID=753702 RepID=A0A1I1EJ70_9LACT|nr:V-type ATP synthase subunit E [Alkalibacterium subtropicum]SFB87154.1 V/A-type H+-transporting ATPase subunit E [Alkalibacterium subtropicum]